MITDPDQAMIPVVLMIPRVNIQRYTRREISRRRVSLSREIPT